MELIDEFEQARPRLLSLAHRLLGSSHDAEDAVQTAWLRTAHSDGVDNPAGWFTTVTARICLDQLRARRRRSESPLYADTVPSTDVAADEQFLRREAVSRALMAMLNHLTPAQRVAYVLHDLFDVPFDQVARAMDTSVGSAKQHASRGRRRLATLTHVPSTANQVEQWALVDAFLDAARGGDVERLVRLLAPEAVRTADPSLLPSGAATIVRGAREVAEETRAFADRVAASVAMPVAGAPGAVVAPGGHPLAVIRFAFAGARITELRIDRSRYVDLG